jgi:hypothetical protein
MKNIHQNFQKAFCLVASLAFLVTTSLHSNASNLTCETVQGDWDWTLEQSFVGSDTVYPFNSSALGAYSNYAHCSEDGWLLYTRKLYCTDNVADDSICDSEPDRNANKPVVPHFALYNKYTGLLRFFVWIPTELSGSTVSVDSLTFNLELVERTSPDDSFPVLINNEDPLRPLDQVGQVAGAAQATATIINEGTTGKWTALDYYTTYPGENYPYDEMAFKITTYGFDETEIQLSGNAEGTLSNVIKGSKPSSRDYLASLWDNRTSIKSAYKDAQSWEEDIIDWGVELGASEDPLASSLAGPVSDLGLYFMSNPSVPGGIGAGVAAFNVVQGLMGSRDSIKTQYINLDLNLEGKISNTTTALPSFFIPLHNSEQVNPTIPAGSDDRTRNSIDLEVTGNLGLFHIKRAPKLLLAPVNLETDRTNHAFGFRLSGRLGDDLSQLIEINPVVSNEMEIAEIRVMPIVNMSFDTEYSLPAPRDTTGLTSDAEDADFGFYQLSCPIKKVTANRNLEKYVDGGYGGSTKRSKSLDPFYMCDNISLSNLTVQKESDEVVRELPVGHYGNRKDVFRHQSVRFNSLVNPAGGAPFLLDLKQAIWIDNGGEDFMSNSYKGYWINHISLKVFIKFKHKTKEDIYLDYVGHINPSLSLCGGSFGEWNGHIFSGTLGGALPDYELVDASVCEGSFDSDSDGVSDLLEVQAGMSLGDFSDALKDYDNDGLTNGTEASIGTSIWSSDSDGDGMSDKWEHENNLNPLTDDSTLDSDGDGSTNLEEFQANSDPFNPSITPDSMLAAWLIPVTILILN